MISEQQLGKNMLLLADDQIQRNSCNQYEIEQEAEEQSPLPRGYISKDNSFIEQKQLILLQPQQSNNNRQHSNIHLVSMIDGKEQLVNSSFEQLKNHSNNQNFHFKTQLPAQQMRGDNDTDYNGTPFRQADSIRESSSLYSRSYGRAERISQSVQNDKTNSLYPETKSPINKIRLQKKSADFMNSYHESGDEDFRHNRKDSKFLSVYVPSIHNKEELNNENMSSSKYQKNGYFSRRQNNSFLKEGSGQQESINQGTKSFRDDISELQNTIMHPKRQGLDEIWKKRSLSIIQKVARFINIMLVFSMKKKFSQLKRQDFELIGDAASSYKYYLYKDQFVENVLKPYQTIKLIWDVIMLVVTSLNIIIMYFYLLILHLLLKQLFYSFKKQTIDLLLRWDRLQRTVDSILTQIRKHLIETFQPGEKIQIVFRIINVFLLIFFIAHIVSSGFVWVAMEQHYNNYYVKTWISQAGLLHKTWGELYLNGLYWAIISMITIGYGDITPITMQEKVYTIVISQIITDLKQKQKKLKERINNLNRFLNTRGLDKHLQIKVRKFIEHLQISEEYEGSALKDLSLIPKQIKEEVQIDIYGKIIGKIKLFHINFSQEAINNVALKITESNFAAGEFLFKQGEQSEKMYILMNGKIELSIAMKNKQNEDIERTIASIQKGHIFGVEDFFGETTRSLTAKATELSRVIEISQKNMLQSLGLSSQYDLEKYQMIRDKVKYSNSTRGLGVQCYYCQSYNHSYRECPNVTLSRNKLLCLAKHNYSQNENLRRPKVRQRIKMNTLGQKPFLTNSINYYLHYRQYQDNLKFSEGFTEETVDNVRQRNISNFSYHMNSQRNIFKKNRSGNDNPNNQTSIKLQAAPNPSIMMVEALDPMNINNPQSDSALDEKSPIQQQTRINLKAIRQKSREHSVNRIQKRNLTNIVEERSFINDTNITSQPSQFQSNLNAMSSTTANQLFLRNSSGVRNLTWNGVQHIIQYQKQQSNSRLDNSIDLQDIQKIPSLLNQYQNSPPQLIPSNLMNPYQNNNSSTNLASHNSNFNQVYNNNNNMNNMNNINLNSNYVATNGNSAYGTNIQNDLAGKSSSNYISINERRNSLVTPKNNGYSNLTNNWGNIPHFPGGKDGQPGGVQSQSQQLIQNTQNSNQYSNSEFNPLKGQQNNNEIHIDIVSIRNIKANNNWDSEIMKQFEKNRIYKHYFPYNNIDKVLLRVNGAYFLIKQKQERKERNKRKQSIKKHMKFMKKNSMMLEGGLNSSKKNTSKKLNLNNVMDLAAISINKAMSPQITVKDKESQLLYTKDKSLSGGQNIRQAKFSYQDSTTVNHPL